jgi:hypothetical protein
MKKSDKRGSRYEDQYESNPDAGRRKVKLKPISKQKYKPKQYYVDEVDDDFSDIDLFGLKEDQDWEQD